MYPAVFRCILLKYCIFAYSDVFQNVFSYLLVCDRDTLCFMYSNVFYTYSECILRRGRDTLRYIQNTSRYTYPLTHLRGTSPSAGLGTSPSLRSLGSAPSGLSLEWGGGLWIYGRAELRVCALGVRIHLAHGRESVFRCIPLYLVLYRVGTLYLDAMPRIRLYSHRTCCILIVSDGFPTRARRYIQNTWAYLCLLGAHREDTARWWTAVVGRVAWSPRSW